MDIKKRMMSIFLSAVVCLTGAKVIKGIGEEMGDGYYEEIPLPCDYIVTADVLNVRLDGNRKSKIINKLYNGDIVNLIEKGEEWSLVSCGEIIGYVYNDYISENSKVDDNNNVSSYKDVLIVNSSDGLNFRTAPSFESERITTLSKGTELPCMAFLDNEWYLVKYNGKLGYVHKDYVTSIKEVASIYYPDAKNIEISSIAYAKEDSFLYINGGDPEIIEKYQSVKIVSEMPDNYLVLYEGKLGYVEKNSFKKLKGTFVIIDISDQKLVCYCNTDEIQTNNVTTGKKGDETPLGIYEIYAKRTNYYMSKYDVTVNYWMAYSGNYGMHDMRQSKPFGGTTYIKNGSHGCVRMSLDDARKLYKKVSVKDKVLVKK